jgi:GTPase Era involved in 16S rRNA processing
MKAIATEARHDMERVFGGKVFLEVFVQGEARLGRHRASLTRFGY